MGAHGIHLYRTLYFTMDLEYVASADATYAIRDILASAGGVLA